MKRLDLDDACAIFDYNPETGHLTWKVKRSNRVKVGDQVGTTDPDGYRRFIQGGQAYFVHRVAWLMHFGKWPEMHIDHINGDKADNRISNLRDVTRSQNVHNTGLRSTNTSGFRGVYFQKAAGKWLARLYVNRKCLCLGYFNSPQAAGAAYELARAKHIPRINHE